MIRSSDTTFKIIPQQMIESVTADMSTSSFDNGVYCSLILGIVVVSMSQLGNVIILTVPRQDFPDNIVVNRIIILFGLAFEHVETGVMAELARK